MLNAQCKILAIETSGTTCGVALTGDEGIIASYSVYSGNLHDKLLADFVKRILNDTSLKVDELSAVAVSSGPGSFTGLRIGASIAKGLCFGGKPPLIAVLTLEALAESAIDTARILNKKEIIAVVPSHKDLLYYQRFSSDGEPIAEIQFAESSELKKIINQNLVLCGPGAKFFDGSDYIVTNTLLIPEYIAKMALRLYKEGKFVSVDEFTPTYVQEFEPKKK